MAHQQCIMMVLYCFVSGLKTNTHLHIIIIAIIGIQKRHNYIGCWVYIYICRYIDLFILQQH